MDHFFRMMHESKEIMIDNLQINSDGLVNVLKKEKLAEARGEGLRQEH